MDTSFLVGFIFGLIAIPISFIMYVTIAKGMSVWGSCRASIDFYDHRDCATFRVPLWSYWKRHSNHNFEEKRMGKCNPGEVIIFYTTNRKLTVGTYVFGVTVALAFACIITIVYVLSAYAYAFNYRRGFEDGRALVSSKNRG